MVYAFFVKIFNKCSLLESKHCILVCKSYTQAALLGMQTVKDLVIILLINVPLVLC